MPAKLTNLDFSDVCTSAEDRCCRCRVELNRKETILIKFASTRVTWNIWRSMCHRCFGALDIVFREWIRAGDKGWNSAFSREEIEHSGEGDEISNR